MDEKKKKIQNGTTNSEPKVQTNLEKKVWKKIYNMTNNDALTADFVLKNRKLLKSLRNCRVRLSKSLKFKPTKKSKTTRKKDQEKSSKKPTTNSSPSTSKQLLKTSPPQNRIQSPKIFIRLPAKNRKVVKNSIRSLLRTNLSKKFDRNLFKCHVRVKRLKQSNPLFTKKLNANRKTVSFMETVEIFGESDIVYVSDSDLDDSNNDDTGDMEDDSFVDPSENPSTSTPILNSTDKKNSFKARRSLLDGKRCVVRLNRSATRINFSITSEANDEHDENKNGDVVMKESKASEEIALETNAQELNVVSDDENVEVTEETTETGATAEQENEVIIFDVEDTENSEVEPQVNEKDVSNKSNQSLDSTKTDESSPEANTDEATNSKLADTTDSKLADTTDSKLADATDSNQADATDSQLADATNSNLSDSTASNLADVATDNKLADATDSKLEEVTHSNLSDDTDSNLADAATDNKLADATDSKLADATNSSHESEIDADAQKTTATMPTTKTNGTIRLSPDPVDSHPPEDLFDLLKSDKLPAEQPPSLSADSHPKIPDFLDSDNEDDSTLNKTSQDNSSNPVDNSTNSANSSRFSLNTFFKSVKDTIRSVRSGSNSPKGSPGTRIESSDSPTTTA